MTRTGVTGKLLHGLMIQTYKITNFQKSAPINSGVTFLFFLCAFGYAAVCWVTLMIANDPKFPNFWSPIFLKHVLSLGGF
ncbi:hypothetical protein DJ90_6475 [Paenibacillus macerans]|uniref:Uncharacterized protein n=1 Tax=Paenibacillus macerans TaxID=44252 RepID=A0A090Y6Q5_PAEMA|nr:hypothetical protein DJ90_6475 [Paenibacillus macerans]